MTRFRYNAPFRLRFGGEAGSKQNTMHRASGRIVFAAAFMSFLLCLVMLTGCSAEDTPAEGLAVQEAKREIIISEVMSSNDIAFPAADGRCYDWVELHNLTDRAYDLSSCFLTDDERSPKKFQLTGLTIEAGGYAVVYLSGLNGVDINGYLHAGFKLSSMGETVYLNDSTGVVMSSMDVPESPRNISYGLVPSDAGDSSDRCAWFAVATPGEKNSDDYADDPSQLTFEVNSIVINEYLTGNTFSIYDSDGEYSDWVELYNPSEEDAPMRGYALADSDDVSSGKWSFPDDAVVPAGGYLLVFCSGKSSASDPNELHCSFRLSEEDRVIALFAPSGVIADSIEIYSLPDNVSCGIDPGSGEKKLYASPTPGRENNTHARDIGDTAMHGIPASAVIFSEIASVSSTREKSVRDYDYVELHNRSAEPVSLSGYGLSDSKDEIKYIFPDVTIEPGEYLLVNCVSSGSIEEEGLVAPFGLNRGGETIFLSYPDGHVADIMAAGKQETSITRGRLLSDLSAWFYFTEPTPGEENPSAASFRTYAKQPVFSSDGGAVEEGFVLTITSDPETVIRYTTDGSRPSGNSEQYKDGIAITETTVIRAAAFRDGMLPSEVTTATFFVNSEHTIPIVSVSSDPDGLFSEENGIYSSGKGLMNGKDNNYRSEVERLSTFEYYVDGKKAVTFDAGIRIFGRGTRAAKQKSFAIMLREIYGAGSVDYPFFEDNPITEFSSLVLRQSGQEWRYSKLRDELCASIMKNHVKVDYMDMTPVALYINGEYWGLYYVREKQNEDYIRARYGYENGELDIIRDQTMAVSGTIDNYKKLNSFVRNNDMEKDENYQKFCEMADIESFMDFWICQSFFGNNDTANIRCHYCPDDESSKWRWMIFDLDNAFYGFSIAKNPFERDMLDPEGHGIGSKSTTIIARKLAQNDRFREDFVKRFCYHLKNTFNTERTLTLLDELVAKIESEIPRQQQRWGEPSTDTWEEHIEMIRDFLSRREKYILGHLSVSFGYSRDEIQKFYDAA